MTPTERRKRRVTAREGATQEGISARHVRRLVSQSRTEYLADMAREREAIRAYHDEEGHSWPETGKHFGISEDTAQQRAYRARKERAAEREAQEQQASQ